MPLAQAGVLDGLRDGLLVLDGRGRIVELNLAARRLVGAAAAQTIGQPLATVLPPVATALARSGVAADTGDLMLHVDGRPRWFDLRPSPLRDRAGQEVGQVIVLTETTDRRRVDELERSRALIVQAEEDLRREIAEQLHGGVQTKLLLAWYRLVECRGLLAADPGRAAALLDEIADTIEGIREQDVRQVSHRLHPSVIHVGLVPALETLVEGSAKGSAGRRSVDVRTDDCVLALDDPVANRLPDPVRLAAYRVVEEALANVYRHAQASRATVELTAPDGTLEIVVRDDGRGFAPGQALAGLGMNAIAARVGQLGGAWWLDSAPGRGTTLTVRLPLGAPPTAGSG